MARTGRRRLSVLIVAALAVVALLAPPAAAAADRPADDRADVIVTFAGKDLGATINGVVPDLMTKVSTIEEHFVEGSLETLASNPNGIVIGTGLADKFGVRLDVLVVAEPS